jgi:hypothetical protein
VASRYGVTEAAVLAWIRSDELRALNVGRKPGSKKPRWRVSEQALAEFEAGRVVTPLVPRARRRRRAENVIEFYRA